MTALSCWRLRSSVITNKSKFMKIVIAPTAFKGTLSPKQAAAAVAAGVRNWRAGITTDLCPLADGGNGFRQVIADATPGREMVAPVSGPLNDIVQARWSLIQDGTVAVIEAAEANGLHLLKPEQLNPLFTSTMGVGELIADALNRHVTDIIVGIGGSATNDGGCGMAHALGVVFKPEHIGIPRGGDLADLTAVDTAQIHPALKKVRIRAACDVRNPLYGEHGAAYIYGPQKFNPNKPAGKDDIALLDRGLRNLAHLLDADERANQPGMGAAGGLGFGLAEFLGAELLPGVQIVMDAVGFDQRIKHANLVITGEGAIDSQSMFGKVSGAVADAAKCCGVPVIGLAGKKGPGWQNCLGPKGLNAVFSIVDDLQIPADEAIANPAEHLIVLTVKALTWFAKQRT